MVTMAPLRQHLADFMVETYLVIPALLFVGASITTRLSRAAVQDLLTGLAALLWFAFAQCLQCLSWEAVDNLSLWWSIYLLAFPFAAVLKDGAAQAGLRFLAVTAIVVSLVMTLCSILLTLDILPLFLSEAVVWDDEGRLAVFTHPNCAGWMLMIGIGFTLAFLFQARNKGIRAALLAGGILQFLALALTNSRTTIVLSCALIAGTTFLRLPRTGWKQHLAGALGALILMGTLFLLSDAVYDWNHGRLLEDSMARLAAEQAAAEQAAAETAPVEFIEDAGEYPADEEDWTEAETEENFEIPETFPEETKPARPEVWVTKTRNSFGSDFWTMNNRTGIWSSAINTMNANPIYWFRGAAQPGVTAIEGGNDFGVMHLHNAWIQMLVGFGVPGLLIALYFTFLALRGALWALIGKGSSMWQKSVALLMLCMLVAGMLEPFLFTGYLYCHFITVVSMMCIGYLNHWYRLRKKPEIDK